MIHLLGLRPKFLSLVLCFCTFSDLSLAIDDREIEDAISKMSLSQKVGHLFCVGFSGVYLTRDTISFIKKHQPGSFVLFGRNIENLQQVSKLNEHLRNLSNSEFPPLIAVDEEGGSVARITTAPPLPNALSIGQTKSLRLARDLGAETGRILSHLGFNMNLAPVLDIADPNRFSFIGVRSLGQDPKIVAKLGRAISEGMLQYKILPTAKHFPGTGATVFDPHKLIISKSNEAEQIFSDLHSFSEFIMMPQPKAVMISHLKYPALDSTNLPGTYSYKIITELLRKELKFDGLVITDDLQMNNQKLFPRKEEAALAALKAGADIVMLTWSLNDQKSAINFVINGIKNGEITEEELNAKLHRILTTKDYLKNKFLSQQNLSQTSSFFSPTIANINAEILKTHFTEQIVDKTPASIGKNLLENSSDTICVFSPRRDFNQDFAKIRKKRVKFFSLIQDDHRLEATINKKRCSLSIIAVLGYKTASLTHALPDAIKKKISIVNMSGPFVIKGPEKYRNVLNLYFPHQGAGAFIAKNLNELIPETKNLVTNFEFSR